VLFKKKKESTLTKIKAVKEKVEKVAAEDNTVLQ